jgi:hypothetical protein
MLAFQAFHLAAYHFAHGTFQPTATGSTTGCFDLDSLLGGDPAPDDLNAALDVCFDPQFSCSHAKVQRLRRRRLTPTQRPQPQPSALTPLPPPSQLTPYPSTGNPNPPTQPNPNQSFVGMATILATSDDDPQSGKQASIRIEGSDTWLPALVPMHAPRGSRTPTTHAVPVVGCFVHDRFVLSWADMRCRSVTDSSFPAECDGADQRNVAVEDTAAAISFVESLAQEGRRKLDLGDTDNTFVKGKKTAIMVIISPSDATSAAASWSDYGSSPNAYVDAVVRRFAAPEPSLLSTPYQRTQRSHAPTDGESQHDVVRMVVG